MGGDTELDALLEELARQVPAVVPGVCLVDRFVIEKLAGVGGMGRVYRAHDRHLGGPVAVKVLSSHHASRFERESRLLAELSHPNLVRYVAHGVTPAGDRFLAMEWLDGMDLAERLHRGPLEVLETVAIVDGVAKALGFAHTRGVVHRDVKPSNIYLVGGDPQCAKLLDLGIARPMDGSYTSTATGVAMGTVGYMAPEQAADAKHVDARTDVFGLGCVMFECLSGRPAFTGSHLVAVLAKILHQPTPRLADVAPHVPQALDDLVAAMLAKDCADRPADGVVVHERLQAWESTARAAPALAVGVAERRLVSVLLADDLEGEVDWDLLQRSVAAAGGEFQQLANGAILVTFRSDLGASEQADPVAGCALALRDAAPSMRVALATGRADRTRDVGPVIDQAAALLHNALPARIAVDEATAGLLVGRFHVEESGDNRWLSRRANPTRDVRTVAGKPTPCVGRTKELALLEAMLCECVDEPVARCVLITGPPGIGKSRVASEFLRRVEANVQVVFARGDAVAPGSELSIARQLVRGIEGPASSDFEKLLEHATKDRVTAQGKIRRAFSDVLSRAAERAPLLLVVDDLHWGDSSSVGMLREVISATSDAPVMIVALARPEIAHVLSEFSGDANVQHVRLTGLSRRAVEKLARAVLGDVDASQLAPITSRADGNALFAEELIRSAVTGGDDSPQSALAILEERLHRLDPSARRVLRAASVLGELASEDGVAHLLGQRAASDWLDVLVDGEVLARDEAGLRFRHGLVRDAAYAMLVDEDRRTAHRLAAEWLGGVGGDALAVAEHWCRSDQPASAAVHFLRAAESAFIGDNVEHTAELAGRGIEVGATGTTRGELRVLQGEGAGWGGERTLGLAEFGEDALSLLPEGSSSWLAALSLYGWGVVHSPGHSHERFIAACETITDLAGNATEALAAWRMVECLLQAGRPDLATRLIAMLDAAVDADADDIADGYRLACHAWAAVFGALDRTTALSNAEAAVERLAATDSKLARTLGFVVHGVATFAARDVPGARAIFEDARDSGDRIGANVVLFVTDYWLGALDAAQQRWEDAIPKLTRVLGRGDLMYTTMAEYALANVHLRTGDVDQARLHAARAIEMSRFLPMLRPAALGTQAALHLVDGKLDEAAAQVAEGLALIQRVGGWPGSDRGLQKLARMIDASR